MHATPPDTPVRRHRPATFAGAILITAVVVLTGTTIALWMMLTASLPRSTGSVTVHGLANEVVIELDALETPIIRTTTMHDALLAQGFVHAQQRYFQMDLARRHAAGELAELFGTIALPLDRDQRRYQLRQRARQLLDTLPAEQRSWLLAYADGVNAGLADLGARPPEYWLLRARPTPWLPEDCVLVLFGMYTMMSMNHVFELPNGVMQATLPEELFAFLTTSGSRFDALVDASGALRSDYQPLPLPDSDVIDLRRLPEAPQDPLRQLVAPPLYGPAGSNQWAVGGALTRNGRAMLANDPHLRLQLPNVFFRIHLHWAEHGAGGISVPGLPGIVIGASDQLAWGATVSNADQSDWVVIEVDPDDPSRYRVPEGHERFRTTMEQIHVRGAATDTLDLRTTRWGPVIENDWLDRPLALRATWLEADGANLTLLNLPLARNVDEALATLAQWSGPSLNWMLADAGGRIGWTINGPVPERAGFDGAVPVSWADGTRGWNQWLDLPAISADENGSLFTANSRTLPHALSDGISRAWMRPLRAHRIATLLSEGTAFTEADFVAMQLDTRAAGYDALRDLLLDVLPDNEPDERLRTVRAIVAGWDGHAQIDQPGFRLLHNYYLALLERVLGALLVTPAETHAQFVYRWPLADEPLRRILEERPDHLLPPGHDDWPAFLRQILVDSLNDDQRTTGASLDRPWGDVNRLTAGHVFADLMPWLRTRLSMADEPLPGSMLSLRVAAPDYGATARLVIAPAAPGAGVLQMPGGQSGHPLSARFDDQTRDWLTGSAVPFLPGPAVSGFVLRPPD